MKHHLVASLFLAAFCIQAAPTVSRNIIASQFSKFTPAERVTAQPFLPLLFSNPDLNFRYGLNGYIRSDALFATRQTEGLIFRPLTTFWPEQQLSTPYQGDANELHTMSISNIVGSVGMWTEGQVHGNTLRCFLNLASSGQRLGDGLMYVENAYVEYTADNWRLLVGQYPHPLMVQTDIPNVISYTYGAPFIARNYTPQITIQRLDGHFALGLTLYSATVFASRGFFSQLFGPDTGDNSFYQFFSGVPGITGTLWYNSDNFSAAFITDFKRIIPQTFYSAAVIPDDPDSDVALKFNKGLNSIIISGYTRAHVGSLRIQAQATYGSNSFDQLLQGGYAISSAELANGVKPSYTQVPRAYKTYAGVYAASVWSTIESREVIHKRYQPGIFVGYSKVLGTRNPIELFTFPSTGVQEPYTFMLSADDTTNITPAVRKKILNSLWRVAPRTWFFISDNLIIGCELEIARATFGYPNNFSKPIREKETTTLMQATVSTQFYF